MLSEQETLLTSQSRNALMGEMISLIAHQWRQPLNIISVLAQSFDEAWEFDEMTPEYTEKQVKLITDQVLYMSDTIEDFRNFFKSQQGQRFNLRDVINKALKLENYMLKQYNIELLVDLEDGIYLTGNPNEIMQVIINLINNARDAMVSADIKKRRISLTMKKVRDKCSISIFNNGTNIPDKIKEKIFEPYFTTRGSAGTGIGLYICQMILKNKYNGSIKAVNHPDGVEFVITVTAS
jgi:signal transduction histidine kinase